VQLNWQAHNLILIIFNIKQTFKRPRLADSEQSRMSIDEIRLQDAQEYGPTDPNCNQHFNEQEFFDYNQYQTQADSNQLLTPSELNEINIGYQPRKTPIHRNYTQRS